MFWLKYSNFSLKHKAENIRDQIKSIIEEYGIRYEKIFRVITDNGSNLVKTFKIEWLDMNEFDDIDFELDEDIDINEGIEEIDSNVDENEFDSRKQTWKQNLKKSKLIELVVLYIFFNVLSQFVINLLLIKKLLKVQLIWSKSSDNLLN